MEAGQRIDEQYRLVRCIGVGGFGDVWLAEEVELGRSVAIKFVRSPGDRPKDRFRREMAALARLRHDHIVTLFAVGESDDGAYLVTEYAPGQVLSQWALGERSIDEIRIVAGQIASALVAAHRAGVVHRDLKPANIIVGADRAGNPRVKVLDFGIAKLAGPTQLDITKTGEVLGTPGFMSPEQLRATNVGPATDLYNLGVILWELIEGRSLFEGDSELRRCMQHLREPPPSLTRPVPAELERLTFRLLAKEPEARGRAEDVLRILQSAPASPRAPAKPRPAQQTARRSTGLVLAALGGLVVSAVVGVALSHLAEEDAPPRRSPQRARALLAPAPEAPPPNRTDPDLGPDPARMPHHSKGCGIPWEPGQILASSPRIRAQTPLRLARDDDRSVIVIPEGYDADRAMPLVLVLHDGAQAPQLMMEQARGLTDIGGFITVFAEGERLQTAKAVLRAAMHPDAERPIAGYPWPQRQMEQIGLLVEVVTDAFCVDTSRKFVVGHGRGAAGAERLLTVVPGFSAVAQTSHRLTSDSTLTGSSGLVIPRIWFVPNDSPSLTDDGKRNDCRHGFALMPYEQQRDELLAAHRCGEAPRAERLVGGICETWDCEVEFVSCRVDGGRHWPGFARKKTTCNEPAPNFDYGAEIWRFFERVSDGS